MSNYFFRNKIHLSLLSALGVCTWSTFFDLAINPWAVLVVFLLTLSIYQYNRLTDDIEDAANETENLADAHRHEFLIKYVLFYFLSALCLVIAVFFGLNAFLITLFTQAVGFFYNQKCFPDWLSVRLGGARRLKDLYIIKNLTPPLDWATAMILLPLVFAGGKDFSPKVWICWGYTFTCAFFIEVMWDIRDRKGDLLSGIKTIANTLSLYKTKVFLILTSSLSGGMLCYAAYLDLVPKSAYFLLSNNIAVMFIAGSYKEEAFGAMRTLSDMTIVLAMLLFISFGLVAYFAH
ncbi:MAG: UbiA family prenyltransferase [Rhizobacter sp.]|nr:UbiA family prenyltransferase [Chlorobiales bacterium]